MQWIDDTILMGNSLDEMYKITERYLARIEKMKLRLSIDKCTLLAKDAEFCGRMVRKEGYGFCEKYARGLLDRAKPEYVHELAQFIYTANFLCSVIPGFAKIRKLVTGKYNISGKLKNLERKKIKLNWTDDLRIAFSLLVEALKRSLKTTLGHYSHQEGMYIFTDASDLYWSLYITQAKGPINYLEPFTNEFRVIAMKSGVFKNSSLDWHVSSKELFPMVFAIKKFPYFLLFNNQECVLFTDHRNLVGILSPKNIKVKAYASRIVYHLDGAKNIPADCLSRWLNPQRISSLEQKLFTINYADEEYWKRVDTYHVSNRHPSKAAPPAASWGEMDEGFILMMQQKDFPNLTEVKKKNNKILLTKSLLPAALYHAHSVYNHGSKRNELRFIAENYSTEDAALLKATLDKLHTQCLHCQRPSLVVKRPLNITEFGSRARQVLYADFLYINQAGWILVIVDSLTRVTSLLYTKTVDANAVVKGLWKWHAYFQLGGNFLLVTDQGSHFVNQVVRKFVLQANGTQKLTAAYVSQTNGTVEVQNRNVLKHLRSLVSDMGLPAERWPDILLMVQGYLNTTPLSCRGPEKKTPFELLMGVKPNFPTIGEGFCDINQRDLQKLQRISRDLSQRIEEYQRNAYTSGLSYRATANRRLNKKLTMLNFHEGEYVLVSEKGTDAGNKDKCRPRWSGPAQIVKVVSEHLYEIQDLSGKRKLRHSCLLIPYAPSSFLPTPSTRAVFLNDKGKLEVERAYDIKKTVEGELQLKIKWKGFPQSSSTWESAVVMFEDIPLVVVRFLKRHGSELAEECLQFLRSLYPDSEYWNHEEVRQVKTSNLGMFDSLKDKMLRGTIFVNTQNEWYQVNWSQYEFQMLRRAVLRHGMGNFVEILKLVRGKNKQQVYTKLQRVLKRQSLELYHGLKIDIITVSKNNESLNNGHYFKLRMPRTEEQKLMERMLTVWRYSKAHCKHSKEGKSLIPVYNPTTLEGLRVLLSAVKAHVKEGLQWEAYPEWEGDLRNFLQTIHSLINSYSHRKMLIIDFMKQARNLVEKNVEGRYDEAILTKALTPNLWKVENKKLNCIIFRWKRPRGCILVKDDVPSFLTKKEVNPDVVILDPPYKVFSENPVRGPRISYNVMKDDEIRNLPLRLLGENILFFVWTISSKRDVAIDMMMNNNIRFLSRLIWVKMTPSGNISSTLGNITGACTEECLIGLKGKWPNTMLKRFLGKEVMFGVKTGNSQKPHELYELIEKNFKDNAVKLELFGRNNNARKQWVTVGDSLEF
eukprot:snap_masked-scaffold_13-processed-gene-3.32-mRNA-1 protein AED:1.00 eAED:1.00 QI:0/0/0/0/1/1/2/0/1264